LPETTGDGTIAVVSLSPTIIEALADRSTTPEEWRGAFAVFVVTDSPEGVPPMLGHHEVRGDTLVFTPRFSFLADQPYRAVLACRGLEKLAGVSTDCNIPEGVLESEFTLSSVASPQAYVEQVFPTSDALPENLLKFYVYFSHPMREGDVYSRVRLTDEEGNSVEQGFVETIPELWGPQGRRLTLICHPGRIKRGLDLNERLGPPLEAGKRYTLVIDAELRDAFGRPMTTSFEKRFLVTAPDRTSPNTEAWRVDVPTAGTQQPVRVTFDEPVDHALLKRFVTVYTDDGEHVRGEIDISSHESVWLYRPVSGWRGGDYDLVVHPTLEDLAGNRLDGVFDRAADELQDTNVGEVIRIPFTIH